MKIVEMILTETWNINTCTKMYQNKSCYAFLFIYFSHSIDPS